MKANEIPEYERPDLQFITDSQELADICERLGIHDFADDITGALVLVEDGDYSAVYLSENTNFKRTRYWDWELPEYYADDVPEELDLQE